LNWFAAVNHAPHAYQITDTMLGHGGTRAGDSADDLMAG